MPKSVFRSFLFLNLFFASLNSYAQEIKPGQKITLRTDSSEIIPFRFDSQAIKMYSKQKEFKYDEAVNNGLTLWDRFWMWFWRLASRILQGAASNAVSKYFFIALGVAIVVYIVLKVIGADNIFSRKSKETILPYDILNENIHEIDYELELQRLIEQGKHRLAVRLLYLRTLKKLADARIIQWQPEKTNYNYLMELTVPEFHAEFSRLTRQFDYIWYGDFPVDADKFHPISQSFNHFNSLIK